MVIEIIPDINIDNSKVLNLLTNIHQHKNLAKRIKSKEEYIVIEEQNKITYEILFTKDKASFNLIFPDEQKELILNELNICYPKATFKEKEEYINRYKFNTCIELELKEHYFLSLRVDKRGLFPLPSLLECSKLLHDNEAVLIQTILIPEENSWYTTCEDAIKNFNKGTVMQKMRLNGKTITKALAKLALSIDKEILNFISLLITDEELNQEEWEVIDKVEYDSLFRNGLSENTKRKPSFLAYDTTIRIAIQCPKDREILLKQAFRQCFNELSEDNSLIERNLNAEKLLRYVQKRKPIFKLTKDLLSCYELSQIIQMPTKAYQQEYKLNSIDTREVEIPEPLLNGQISLGKASNRGKDINVYWNENYNVLSLPKVIVGPMGAGKTEYAVRYAIEAGNKGDAVVVFDYIKNCEMSEKVKKHAKAKVYEINLVDIEKPFAFAYNEVQILPSDTKFKKIEKANRLAEQTRYLIDSLTTDITQPLTSKMQRYLNAACMVVYINPNEKIETVLNVLMNHKIRHTYIDKALESGIYAEDDIEIQDLLSLDEHDKDGNVIDTKENKIEGIIDRFNILMRNIYLKQMIKSDPNNNPNFEKLFDEGYTILIRMPESVFSNKQVKDTIVTFFMSKIWLTELIRGGKQEKPRIVHVITDEVHQIPTAAKLISDVIDEARKYGCAFFFTVHYLKQFKSLLDSVKSAGVSYMLLGGTEKENYMALKEELGEFTIEEAMSTKPFHSLNIINYGNTRAIFDTELPRPL